MGILLHMMRETGNYDMKMIELELVRILRKPEKNYFHLHL